VAEAQFKDTERRMDGAIEVLRKEFAGLRTGRASASLLEPIQVEAYGSRVPLNQVGNVNVPEPRMITVQVWDKSLVKAVEAAIPKIAGKYGEQARVSVRNVRRDAMDKLKRMERDHEISQDQHREWSDRVQKLTDEHIKKIDTMLATKEHEIKQV
jgi:ribosome recycling factor